MLIATAMRNAIKVKMDALNGNGNVNANEYMTAFGSALSLYIKDNINIKFNWIATMPIPPAGPGTPDPLVAFNAHIIYMSFPLTVKPTRAEWLLHLSSIIRNHALIVPWMYSPPLQFIQPIIFPAVAVVPTTITINEDEINNAETQDDALLITCEAIINYIKTLIQPVPAFGIRGPYTIGGTATMVNIQ